LSQLRGDEERLSDAIEEFRIANETKERLESNLQRYGVNLEIPVDESNLSTFVKNTYRDY